MSEIDLVAAQSMDFLDPNVYEKGLPLAALRTLRNEAPVSWHLDRQGLGYWFIARHADVYAALRDPARFSSELGSASPQRLTEAELVPTRQLINSMDPPRHSRVRGLVTRPFAMKMIEQLRPRLREISLSLVSEVAERGSFDAIECLADPLPMAVLLELLGVPFSDRKRLAELSNALMHVEDPEFGAREDLLSNVQEIVGYFAKLSHIKRAHPADDLMSKLASATLEGEQLSDEELGLFFLPLLVAGTETTRSSIGWWMQIFAERPELLRQLKEDRALIPAAIEEHLRFTSPVMQLRRTAASDFEFGGQQLKRNDMVMLGVASANFDDRVFTDPETFSLTREKNPHIAFGMGPHLCIGAAMARAEMDVFLNVFLDRFSRVEIVGPMRRIHSCTMSSLKALPIQLT